MICIIIFIIITLILITVDVQSSTLTFQLTSLVVSVNLDVTSQTSSFSNQVLKF